MRNISELDCRWHFARQLGGRDDGPNNPMQSNFKRTPYASLIRESIQNSLDVPLDSEQPVRMEFVISDINANNYPNFFELKRHIKSCLDYFPDSEDAKSTYEPMLDFLKDINRCSKLKYIRVSDYNTTGMSYESDDTSQPFYAFVRSAGVSSKNDNTKGGSFGFGKAAYFYISPIRTLLVSTQTNEGEKFFEGVSSLCTHKYEEDGEICRHEAVGYYDNNNGEPVSNPDNIPLRFERKEPGTDIYIMGINGAYDDEMSELDNENSIFKEMAIAVLRNFWMAIENRKLEINIGNLNNPESLSYKICSDTLPNLMDEFFPEAADVTRDEEDYNPRPYWEAVHYASSDKNHVLIEGYLENLGHVKLYAYKNKNAQDKVLYMRKPLMLVYAQRTKTANGFYGVFVCDDDEGNAILRKTEDSTHKQWKKSNWQKNGKRVPQGGKALREMKQFILDCIDSMFPISNDMIQDIPGTADFLYILTADDNDEDADNEGVSGEPINQKDEEGTSISSDISTEIHKQEISEQTVGKVIISTGNTERFKKSKTGKGKPSGHGHQKKEEPGGGKMTNKNIDGRYNEDSEGENCTEPYPIPVRYRTFAIIQNDNRIVHRVIIHCNKEHENVEINFIVGGEQSDDEVAIKNCNIDCNIIDNVLCNVYLKEGVNKIDIEFADNMKHALKLEPYEFK